MIYDMSDVINDSFFNMTANIVTDGGTYDSDGIWVNNATTTPIFCHIQPLSNSDIQLLPQGTAAKDCKKIFTAATLSDDENVVIEYAGRRYKLWHVESYAEYNYHEGYLILKH